MLISEGVSISPSNEVYEDSMIDETAICSLARLIGDSEKARTRAERLYSSMKTIEMESPEGEVEVFKRWQIPVG